MSDDAYTFDGVGLSPVRPGTTLLVATSERAGSRLARGLVLAGNDRGEGMVFVSTNTAGRPLLADSRESVPDLDTSRLGVVDASGTADTATDTDAQVGLVASTGDLTGISIEFSAIYSTLYRRGVTRTRTVFDSISTLRLYADFRTITRFVHTMVGRISKTDGFGAFVLDPAIHESRMVGTLSRLCDGQLELRAAGDGYELRVDGLGGQPSGWQPAGI